jgi:hypothetical protein
VRSLKFVFGTHVLRPSESSLSRPSGHWRLRPETTCGKSVFWVVHIARFLYVEWFFAFFNLYRLNTGQKVVKSIRFEQSKCFSLHFLFEKNRFRLDFRASLRNTLQTSCKRPLPLQQVCVGCLFLRSPSRIPYRTELIPRAPKLEGGVPGPHPP